MKSALEPPVGCLAPAGPALHYTALHCTTLHCTEMHGIHVTVLHYNVLHQGSELSGQYWPLYSSVGKAFYPAIIQSGPTLSSTSSVSALINPAPAPYLELINKIWSI